MEEAISRQAPDVYRVMATRYEPSHTHPSTRRLRSSLEAQSVAEDTVAQDAKQETPDASRLGAANLLTRRQCEVAALIARGYSNRQIAKELVVTPGTAANHVAQIIERLGVANRTQVAIWAIARGLAAR
jgi:DNA-binding NarL/FixJ family response regulator